MVAGVQAKIDLDLLLRISFSPHLVVYVRQRNVWLRVLVVEAYRRQLFLHRSVELTPLLQHVAQAEVCLRELRVKPQSFPQIAFRLPRVAHKLHHHSAIQIRPRGRVCPIERNGCVKILDRKVVLVLVEVAEPQVVVCTRHGWIQGNGLLEVADRLCVMVSVVIKPPKPVGVERVFCLACGK